MPTRSSPGRFTATDLVVCALILTLGVVPFVFYQRAPDFLTHDVLYVELGKSLLFDGSYSFNGATERLQPPGLPIMFGLACFTIGCTHDILTRTMPIFLTLGFILSYAIIRSQLGRPVAVVSCVLLASSPTIFPFATTMLWPSFPYFFVTMLFLFLASKLRKLKSALSKFSVTCLLCLLLTAVVMIQSVGIALIGAFLGSAILSLLRDTPTARSQLKVLVPIILAPLVAQMLWMQRGGNTKDWLLPGYPGSYLSQLKLKNGNYPELGFAHPKDIVFRVQKNLKERIAFLGNVLTRHWIRPSWASPIIIGLIVLIVCGVWSALLRGDSQLCALYFVFYECIYLLWPWSFDVPRFTIPVLPLACLYLAEGALTLWQWCRQQPRIVGELLLPVSVILASLAAKDGWAAGAGHDLQDRMSVGFWAICAAACARLIWKGSILPCDFFLQTRNFCYRHYLVGRLSFHPLQILLVFAVTCLAATGVAAEIPIGLQNLVSGETEFENNPEIQAGRWIQSHTDRNATISSRGVPLVHYYSRRRVIWFPPISNPTILMQGLKDHRVKYVIIIERNFTYYFPSEAVCFDLLNRAYPKAFRLIEGSGQQRIYEVVPALANVMTGQTN